MGGVRMTFDEWLAGHDKTPHRYTGEMHWGRTIWEWAQKDAKNGQEKLIRTAFEAGLRAGQDHPYSDAVDELYEAWRDVT